MESSSHKQASRQMRFDFHRQLEPALRIARQSRSRDHSPLDLDVIYRHSQFELEGPNQGEQQRFHLNNSKLVSDTSTRTAQECKLIAPDTRNFVCSIWW